MDWTAVNAVAAVVVPVSILLWAFNRSTFSNALTASNKELIAMIDGTYIRSAGSKLTGDEIERRLKAIDARFDKVESKLDHILRIVSSGLTHNAKDLIQE